MFEKNKYFFQINVIYNSFIVFKDLNVFDKEKYLLILLKKSY
jgi:hypothetical protein